MKVIITVNYFRENDLSQMFDRVLNMPGFRIHHGSEFASGSEYTRFLNIPGLQRDNSLRAN